MISGGLTTLAVSDVDRAIRFYVETLGFKLLRRRGSEWAEVDAGGGFVLGLHRAHAHGGSPGARGGCGVAFELNQPIDEVVAVLANRGVKFEGPVVEDGAVKRAFFADPDGNALHLVEEKRSS